MPATPSVPPPQLGPLFSGNGRDILQIVNTAEGRVLSWIDVDGKAQGNLATRTLLNEVPSGTTPGTVFTLSHTP